MEKQRSTFRCKSCRRLLTYAIFFFFYLPLHAQSLSSAQIKQLKFSPAEQQKFYTKNDIKFSVTIPVISPSQVQVQSAEQNDNVTFRSMRKVENYGDSGTILEIWYSFEKKGEYKLSPLSVIIENRIRNISFEDVVITEDPAKLSPRIVIVFDNGQKLYSEDDNEFSYTKPFMSIPEGEKIHFRVNLQYAAQLVKFTWDIPQNSIFTKIRDYEFTEAKSRERIYSHNLIPLADFEWTGLKEGQEPFPKFRISATGYNGYINELFLPEVIMEFYPASNKKEETVKKDIYYDAFLSATDNTASHKKQSFSNDECKQLAELYSNERNAFFRYYSAKQKRIAFEEKHEVFSESKELFPSIFIYISLFIMLLCISGFIISKIKKQKIILVISVTFFIFSLAFFIYSYVKRCEKFGICKGCKIYSIPENTAAASSDIVAGSKVRIIETTGGWLYIELGETGGWCSAEDIYIIK